MKIFLKQMKISFMILINGSYRCCITINLSEGTGIVKSNNRVKNVCFVTIAFLTMGLNFKILSIKVVTSNQSYSNK